VELGTVTGWVRKRLEEEEENKYTAAVNIYR
jgi:hypothetical protein